MVKPKDLAKSGDVLDKLDKVAPLPHPYDRLDMEPDFGKLKDSWKADNCATLDGIIGVEPLKRPKTKEEERELIKKFLSGLDKLFSKEVNRGPMRPLSLIFEYCAKCNTCASACHIYEMSLEKEIYRPLFRSETLRKMYTRHKKGKGLVASFLGGDIDINIESILRLGELAYRCNVCRRCAQTCPLGLDNAIITREIRKIFSMEMGIAPLALHEQGTMRQLEVGSSTGMSPSAFRDIIKFMEEEIGEFTGKPYKVPVDKKGADILLIHNAGEYISWLQNPMAFEIIFSEAGLNWTLSSDMIGYDNVNYGLFYDDAQLRKIGTAHFKVAKKLGVQRIIIGECGHAHRVMMVSMDRLIAGEDNIPRESCFPLLWQLVKNKEFDLDPKRNNFPVTLHDPCNYVRSMGIVEPQRKILRAIAPQFREMAPHGVYNYCCGGGSGFAIMNSFNFNDFRYKVAHRKKFQQTLEAFRDTVGDKSIPKYVCAPCSNCKGAYRDMLVHYRATEKFSIHYDGVVELIVNAMTKFKKPYLEFLRKE
jgi:Fe-S oxidoreductase